MQDFVNTLDRERARDMLESAEDLRAWFRKRRVSIGDDVTPAAFRRARSLREALRSVLAAHNGEPVATDAIRQLNEAARRARLTVQFDDRGDANVTTSAAGLDGALGELLRIAVEAASEGTWARLKACRNCAWAFYDYSPNRSATWCSMTICGNRLKTRAYRRRSPSSGVRGGSRP